MDETNKRFMCLPDKSGTWMVWDNELDGPAVLGGCVLRGRTKLRAKVASDILGRIYANRLDARSSHQRSIATPKRHL